MLDSPSDTSPPPGPRPIEVALLASVFVVAAMSLGISIIVAAAIHGG